jgi:hypothetical protein
VDGMSLVPLLRGQQPDWRDTAFVEFWGVNGLSTTMLTVRHGDLKYGWNCTNRDELYDLAVDPRETHNLCEAPEYADRLREMRERTAEFMDRTGHSALGLFRASRLRS